MFGKAQTVVIRGYRYFPGVFIEWYRKGYIRTTTCGISKESEVAVYTVRYVYVRILQTVTSGFNSA